MQTATEMMKAKDEDRDNERLNFYIRAFIKNFEPEDRNERLDFEMALHHLMREVYREASKPYERALTASVLMSPLPFSAVGSLIPSGPYPPKP